jgi:TonB family protein
MGFRISIAFSLVVHALIAAAVCAIGFRNAVFQLPEPNMLIALVEGLSDGSPAQEHPGVKRNISLTVKKSSSYSGNSRDNDLTPARQETKSDQYPSVTMHDIPSSSLINSEFKNVVTYKTSGQAQDSGLGMRLSGGSASSLQGKGMQEATGHNAGQQTNENKGDANSNMYRMIRASIDQALVYPSLARKRGIEGTVITEFTISSSGHPENIKIVRSSGFGILDAAARDTILKASPFPVIKGNIEIPITFILKK